MADRVPGPNDPHDNEMREVEVAFIAAYRNLVALHMRRALGKQWNRHPDNFIDKAIEIADGLLIDEERTIAVCRIGGLSLRRPMQQARARARFLMRRAAPRAVP